MGKFRKYIDLDDTTVIEESHDNVLTIAGRRFILDRMFNTGSAGWNNSRAIYMGVGGSTDTNAGVVGPSVTANVSASGSWQGASAYDWKLSSPFGNPVAVETRRTGQTVSLVARIPNSQFVDAGAFGTATIANVLEAGVFLGATYPTANPIEDTSQEQYAMIARSVYYGISGSSYIFDPIYKPNNGQPLPVKYEYSLEV